jgi:hypothetical protein
MRRTRLAMIATLLAGLVVLSATAQTQEARGSVTNRDGAARSGCQVSFTGPERYTAWTNASGAFSIQNPVDGAYTVVVRQGQQVSPEFRVTVSGRNTLTPSVLVVGW